MPDEEKIMADEVAQNELSGIADFFDTKYSDAESAALIPVISDGRLYLDEDQKRVIFELKRPLEKKDKTSETHLRFRNPNTEDIIRINKGFIVTGDSSGGYQIDSSSIMERDIKAASIITGVPLGVMNRIGRKDFKAVSTLLNFLD